MCAGFGPQLTLDGFSQVALDRCDFRGREMADERDPVAVVKDFLQSAGE